MGMEMKSHEKTHRKMTSGHGNIINHTKNTQQTTTFKKI